MWPMPLRQGWALAGGRCKATKSPAEAGLFGPCRFRRSIFVVARRRRLEVLQSAEQVILAHAVELDIRVVAGAGRRRRPAEKRHGLRLRLVDLDVFLQRVDELLLQVVG